MTSQSLRLDQFVSQLAPEALSPWAWQNFHRTVTSAIDYFGARTVLEVGGGRAPMLPLDEIGRLGVDYVVNDVAQRELDLAPAGYEHKLCLDISREQPDIECDLIFSRMVHEHIPDNARNLRHQLAMLRPGGIIIHFHPVLYSIPFFLNWVLPEDVGVRLLRQFQSNRTDTGIPKFPARYDWCHATQRQHAQILELGFAECHLQAFYGHSYFRKIPGAQSIVRGVSKMLAAGDIRRFATYCFTMARKAPA